MSRTRKEKERAQKLWEERRKLLRFGYGKLAESLVREACQHYQRALQAWAKGDLTEAEAFLRQSLNINPDAPDPLLMLGRLLVETGRAEEAVGYLSKACEVDSENPEAHYWFARALEGSGRLRRAREAYEHALQRNLKPEMRREIQTHLEALAFFLTQPAASSLPEEQAQALEEALHWARFYLDMGFPRRAREYLRQAQEIAPDHPQVCELMSRIEKALSRS